MSMHACSIQINIVLNLLHGSSKAIDPTTLCIHSGKAAWVIYVDAVCVNYDGNILDATVLAVVAALQNGKPQNTSSRPCVRGRNSLFRVARIPVATYDPETERTTCSRTERVPLALTHMPLTTSFGVFDRCVAYILIPTNPHQLLQLPTRTHLLSDPSSFEEPLLDATITVTLDVSSGTLLGINQVGFSAPTADLETITQRGLERSKVLAETLIQSRATVAS